ncbi:MAG: hypothetical protein QNJ07_05675 [Woeseiaceae bacterium]|nr:hypothetical protein [Woeseiaceae bacterium]
MSNTLVLWGIFLGVPALFGVLLSIWIGHRAGLLLSGLAPWCIFLVFNLYSNYRGPEEELLQAEWVFFQITLGTLVALSGLLGYWLTEKAKR